MRQVTCRIRRCQATADTVAAATASIVDLLGTSLAGTPTTVVSALTSLNTTDPAPIIAPLPIFTYCKICAPTPTSTPVPSSTPPDMLTVGLTTEPRPITTSWPTVQDMLTIQNGSNRTFTVAIVPAQMITPSLTCMVLRCHITLGWISAGHAMCGNLPLSSSASLSLTAGVAIPIARASTWFDSSHEKSPKTGLS